MFHTHTSQLNILTLLYTFNFLYSAQCRLPAGNRGSIEEHCVLYCKSLTFQRNSPAFHLPLSICCLAFNFLFIYFLISWGGMRLSPLGTSATVRPIVPAPDDRWWWVWSSRIRIGRGNRSTQRKPTAVPLAHHKSRMTWPGPEPGPPRWEANN
jgi:hypothetical protein